MFLRASKKILFFFVFCIQYTVYKVFAARRAIQDLRPKGIYWFLWMDSAFKICFAGVSPFSIKIQLKIEKLAYVGFGFVCAAGKIFKERPPYSLFFLSLVLRAAQPFGKLSKPFLWKISASNFCFAGKYPFQTKIHLKNDKLAYMGFVFL